MPKNKFMAEDFTQDEVNYLVLNNSRLTAIRSKYYPVIVGSIVITTMTQSVVFGIAYLGLAVYSFFRMKKEMKALDGLMEAGA